MRRRSRWVEREERAQPRKGEKGKEQSINKEERGQKVTGRKRNTTR